MNVVVYFNDGSDIVCNWSYAEDIVTVLTENKVIELEGVSGNKWTIVVNNIQGIKEFR